uniref:Uncharacterized protein n=1 Tax=Arundo donax TaxID=35708 RepID=A0A0A9A3D3_ARUDO
MSLLRIIHLLHKVTITRRISLASSTKMLLLKSSKHTSGTSFCSNPDHQTARHTEPNSRSLSSPLRS